MTNTRNPAHMRTHRPVDPLAPTKPRPAAEVPSRESTPDDLLRAKAPSGRPVRAPESPGKSGPKPKGAKGLFVGESDPVVAERLRTAAAQIRREAIAEVCRRRAAEVAPEVAALPTCPAEHPRGAKCEQTVGHLDQGVPHMGNGRWWGDGASVNPQKADGALPAFATGDMVRVLSSVRFAPQGLCAVSSICKPVNGASFVYRLDDEERVWWDESALERAPHPAQEKVGEICDAIGAGDPDLAAAMLLGWSWSDLLHDGLTVDEVASAAADGFEVDA